MVFFAEIAFIYGGNDSPEKDVFGSEKSSEKIIKSSERSSETTAISSGTQYQSSWTTQATKTSMGTSVQQRSREKHTKIRFKCDFCEKTTKIALKNGLNSDLGIIILI